MYYIHRLSNCRCNDYMASAVFPLNWFFFFKKENFVILLFVFSRIFNTQKYTPNKILTSGIFQKCSKTFANFSLHILIKYMFLLRKEYEFVPVQK